jgi:hypothetical protein
VWTAAPAIPLQYGHDRRDGQQVVGPLEAIGDLLSADRR